jgi:hypothetical protein
MPLPVSKGEPGAPCALLCPSSFRSVLGALAAAFKAVELLVARGRTATSTPHPFGHGFGPKNRCQLGTR